MSDCIHDEESYFYLSSLKIIMVKASEVFLDSHWSSDITVLNINVFEIKLRI